jgi:nicotinate phosphoribosyltransferase
MVQLFMALGGSELDAFRAYAEVYPDDCLLLVDTVNTLESGVPNAIKVFEELRCGGHRPVGVRLDSGDLVHLAIQTARQLNDAGFPDTAIVLSSDLDELIIRQILTQIEQDAPRAGVDAEQLIGRLVYGVGTRLVTSWGQPALGGVYKLVAVRDEGKWQPAIKLSETSDKTPNPAAKQAWRLYGQQGKATADLLALEHTDPRTLTNLTLHDPGNATQVRNVAASELTGIEPLLQEVVEEGKRVGDAPTIEDMRALRRRDVERLDESVKRLVNPAIYQVSLTPELWRLKQELIRKTRGGAEKE